MKNPQRISPLSPSVQSCRHFTGISVSGVVYIPPGAKGTHALGILHISMGFTLCAEPALKND